MTNRLTLTAPDDWHIHLRDEFSLSLTVPHAAKSFERAIVMPNLVPPVLNAKQALQYKQRILDHVPENTQFEPLMVLYLTDNTRPQDIIDAKHAGVVACKLYPAGATTNSDSGVTKIEAIFDTLEAMQEHGIKLLVHGEVTHLDVDIFDREAVFLEEVLTQVTTRFPSLKVVLEHITTKDSVDFVSAGNENIAATITAHHLLFNRNHMLVGGIRPHYYCLPILKRRSHQEALLAAATSGNAKFFLGTDSAPHATHKKEAACGCAGAYTAYAALALYAEAFDGANALDKLEGFASLHGADFYQLPRNTKKVTLEKTPWEMPVEFPYGDHTLKPLLSGETVNWKVVG